MRDGVHCPMCKGQGGRQVFPYATTFNDVVFTYLECTRCKSAFVSPHPDASTLAKMYASDSYHDQHYVDVDQAPYRRAAQLLQRHLAPQSSVLDFGCGSGHFLGQLKSLGLHASGVEFDPGAAQQAARRSGCPVDTVEVFQSRAVQASYDAIHLGDVLEHLIDPQTVLVDLLGRLKPGGLLFVEGPLERNPSLVCWASQAVGALKLSLGRYQAHFPPTHLIRTNALAQRTFFELMAPEVEALHWRVFDTGWPYAGQGVIRGGIARMAVALGGLGVGEWRLGNRFEGVFKMSARPTSSRGSGLK